jgi:superfamily II DNA or RNA helicase
VNHRGFSLVDWQEQAVETWLARPDRRGTLEIFTGGGKTLIALACAARLSQVEPQLNLAIVAPTIALAAQWREAVLKYTDVQIDGVRTIGGGSRDIATGARVLIAVLNTASKRLPIVAPEMQPLMLVVDECHRAGSAECSRLFQASTYARLGLSATPDREETDEEGELIAYDEQLLGRELGPVIYSFSLRDARERGWLPRYTIEHHGVELTADELTKYEQLSNRIEPELFKRVGTGGFVAAV